MRLTLHSICLALIASAALAVLPMLAAGCGGGGEDLTLTTTGTTDSNGSATTEGGGSETESSTGIDDFGESAEGEDRDAVLAAFDSYLAALAAGDVDETCARLSEGTKRALVRFTEGEGKGKTCKAILSPVPAKAKANAREKANSEVIDVRIEDSLAHVILEVPGGDLYQMPFAREGGDGEWLASLVAPSVFTPAS
jgi:hypothetical protein